LRILPLYVSHCGNSTFDLRQNNGSLGNASRDTSFSVTISPDCAVKNWVTLTGFPTLSDTALNLGATASTYSVSKNLEDDADPAGTTSWSGLCGYATISLINAPEFITIDSATGTISIEPTCLTHVGVWNWSIERTGTGIT
jgi:hypothetical protein